MTHFEAWESELGPEITGIGVPLDQLSDAELEARIDIAESYLLEAELDEVSSGRMTPDELAEEARRSREILGDDDLA